MDVERLRREAARLNLQLVEARPPMTPEEQREADLHAAMRLLFAAMVEDVQVAYRNGSEWAAGDAAFEAGIMMDRVIAASGVLCGAEAPYEAAADEWIEWGRELRERDWP